MICPECHDLHDDAGLYSYCAQCWAFDLDDAEKAKIIETAEFAKRKACPHCGSRRTETFCGQCGHRVKPMTLRERVAASCGKIAKKLLAPPPRSAYAGGIKVEAGKKMDPPTESIVKPSAVAAVPDYFSVDINRYTTTSKRILDHQRRQLILKEIEDAKRGEVKTRRRQGDANHE